MPSPFFRRAYKWFTDELRSFRDPNHLKLATKCVAVSGLKVINLFCAIHIFTEYIGRPSLMAGPSMLPTLATDGEIVIEDRLTFRLNPSKLSRGDLVILKSPIDPIAIICKRVVGVPGDVVCVDPTGQKAPSTEHVLIPKGHIWLSGDNAQASRDSRDYGPVPIALIQAKLFARVWPWSERTIFRNPMTVLS